MNDRMQQIVSYYQNYKNDIIPNDDLIAIISNFKIMASIEKIDDMIINEYGDNMIDRLDFYNQIYHHHILDIIIEQIEYKDDKNYFIFAMIVVELHKCNLTNHITDSFTESSFTISLWFRDTSEVLDKINLFTFDGPDTGLFLSKDVLDNRYLIYKL
jgi:hypothetical protein